MRSSYWRLLLLFWCIPAQAATYYEWRNQAISQTWWSAAASSFTYSTSAAFQADAVSRFTAWWNANGGAAFTNGPSCNQSSGTAGSPTSAGQTFGCQVVYSTATQTNASGGSVGATSFAVTVTCTSGAQRRVGYSSSPTVGSNYCGSDHCEVTIDSGAARYMLTANGQRWITTATATGNACNVLASTNVAPTYTGGNGSPCFVDSTNTTSCAPPIGSNCGTVNGDPVCVSSVPTGSCNTLPSGAMVCGATASATTPPAPNNGSSTTTPATPTATISGDAGAGVTNYYNSTTVVNQAGGGSSSSGGGSSGSSSSGSSVDECLPGEECAGDLPIVGEEGDCTFSECVGDFVGRVQSSDLVSAVSDVSAAFPSGSCPSWNIEAFDHTYSLSAPMCSIWEDVAPLLSAVMLLVWGWIATRIVLSA